MLLVSDFLRCVCMGRCIKVIHVLWEELQERYRRGEFCMLRKALQNALLVRLSGALNDGRMSKNKVNKIFQVRYSFET